MCVSAATGLIEGNPCEDLLKVGVFGRHGENKEVALGFVAGFGARVGAGEPLSTSTRIH